MSDFSAFPGQVEVYAADIHHVHGPAYQKRIWPK